MLWRGTFLLLVGQFLFLLSGYGVNIVLARNLGPDGYGTFGVVYSLLVVFELLVVAGIPNALQRFVGENPAHAYALHKVMFRWQFIYTAVVFCVAIASAPFVVGFFQDERMTLILQIAAVDIPFFSFYWYFNGLQIGLKNFGRQTLIASSYSMSKFIFVSLLVIGGFSVLGAFVGNILGSICGLALGVWFMRLPSQQAAVSKAVLSHFIVANILYSIGLNLFFYIDLWFVKYYLSDSMVGFYNAASTIGRIPYFFSIALIGALLPSLSYAIGQGRQEEIERIIRQSVRSIIILVMPAMVVCGTSAPQIVVLFFGEQYVGAATILQRLVVGLSMLAVFSVISTVAMAKNGMKACTAIVLALVIGDFFLNASFVPRWGAHGAALATTVTMITGVIISSLYVLWQYRVFVQIAPVLRILAASAVMLLISLFVQSDNYWEFGVRLLFLLSVYFIALRLLGEISQSDVENFRMAIASKIVRQKAMAP